MIYEVIFAFQSAYSCKNLGAKRGILELSGPKVGRIRTSGLLSKGIHGPPLSEEAGALAASVDIVGEWRTVDGGLEIKVASAEAEAVEKKPRSHGGKVLRKNTHDSNTSHYKHGSIIWRFVNSNIYGITHSRYFILFPSGFSAINSFRSKRPIRHMNVSWPSAQGLHQKLNNSASFFCFRFLLSQGQEPVFGEHSPSASRRGCSRFMASFSAKTKQSLHSW